MYNIYGMSVKNISSLLFKNHLDHQKCWIFVSILIKLKLANFLARAFDLAFSDCHISTYNTYNVRHII